jgi:hypothetical protein
MREPSPLLPRRFDRFLLVAILVNCAILAAYDPLDKIDASARNQLSIATEPIFTAIFTFDMVVKIIALDVWGKPGGYFNDGWNWCAFGSPRAPSPPAPLNLNPPPHPPPLLAGWTPSSC